MIPLAGQGVCESRTPNLNCYEGLLSLQISTRESGDVTILDLRGRATLGGGSQVLNSRLQELVAGGVRKLLLNLEHLTQIDSSCFSIIVRTRTSVRGRGGDLKLLRPSGHVLETFKVMHLLEIIPSFEDEAQALTTFRPQGSFRNVQQEATIL